MMKKNIITLLALAIASASFAQTQIGYTNGNFGRNTVTRAGSSNEQGMAIRLSHEKLQLLKGKTITGLTAVYGSRNMDDKKATCFITTDLNGTPLVQTEDVVEYGTTKWDDCVFDKPYTITGDEPQLFIGTKFTIGPTYQALSFDFSKDNKEKTYVISNGRWIDSYGLGAGNANLMVVLAEELEPFTDLIVKDLKVDGYFKAGSKYAFSPEVLNFGNTTINSFDVEVSVNGDSPATYNYSNLGIAPGETYTVQLPKYSADVAGKGTLVINVKNINGSSDADTSDNVTDPDIFIYPADMQRTLLVEEFTGQTCPNCPEGARTVLSTCHASGYDIMEVLHHSGYAADNFTMANDGEYTVYYGSGSTYAPACMVNRMHIPGNVSNGTIAAGPVFNVSAAQVQAGLDYAANSHPYVAMSMSNKMNPSTREVEVEISWTCHEDMPEGDNIFNVMIVQDSIFASQSSGGNSYCHRYAYRGSLIDSAYGAALEKGTKYGETYTWKHTFTLPTKITSDYAGNAQIPVDDSKIHLVAYIGHYHPTNINDHAIYNCISTKLNQSKTHGGYGTGINEITVSAPVKSVKSGVYDLNGRRVGNTLESLPRGMYIVNGKKVMK